MLWPEGIGLHMEMPVINWDKPAQISPQSVWVLLVTPVVASSSPSCVSMVER